VGQNLRRDQFINQNAPVLGVIAELYDVIEAVIALQQVRLRATPHLAHEAARIYRHSNARQATALRGLSSLARK